MNSRVLLVVSAIGFLLAIALPSPAQNQMPEWLTDDQPVDKGEQLPFGYVRSIDAMTSGFATADSLDLAAEYATMNFNFDQAIRILKRALEKNDDDLDIHKAYAEALQGKLDGQSDPDPKLYNDCVKEWLIVLRTERGDEKGINNDKGRGLPMMNKIYEDEEHAIPAKFALKKLVGSVPKAGETDDQYLKRVCKPAELNVQGKILSPGAKPPAPPVLWMK
ncbi:MAG TPA: tetratricopeptide repeat protein [Candidatus Obscuribacterales bacterium]